MAQAVEDLRALIEVSFGIVGSVSAVDPSDVETSVMSQGIDDTGTDSDFVDDEVSDLVVDSGVDDSAGGVHGVGPSDFLDVQDARTLSDDDDGFVVSVTCDIDSHDRLLVGLPLCLASDGGFDEFECDQGVVGVVGELAEDSCLIEGRVGAV